jgi:hypothetical protein
MWNSELFRAIVEGPGSFAIDPCGPAPFDLDALAAAVGEEQALDALLGHEEHAAREACRRFVAPLLASATQARLYPSTAFHGGPLDDPALLPRRKGYREFDLSRDAVTGREAFWSAGLDPVGDVVLRGTVVVVQPPSTPLTPSLDGCWFAGIFASRRQIVRTSSAAAVAFAEATAAAGSRAFLFTATQGLSCVVVFPPRDVLRADCAALSELPSE